MAKIRIVKIEPTNSRNNVIVDTDKIIGIGEPKSEDSLWFEVYFDNSIWLVDVACHEGLLNTWLGT